jgi:hydroxyacylglutathione hydrolase
MTLIDASLQLTDTIPFDLDHAAPGNLEVQWIHGSISAKHNQDPDIQVHAYNQHTYILRQNMAVHAEAPFMYLFFGNDRVMLLDTGATEFAEFFPLRQTVDQLINQWLLQYPRSVYPLVVAHTHLHLDHIEADSQFFDRPHTEIVGLSLEETQEFYGFSDWPNQTVEFDLGGRVLKVLATPGHEEAEVSIYDPYTQILITGDIFYPGRLYVRDWSAFTESIDRLIAFAETYPITHVMGCHIEMSRTPGQDYKIRTTYQPDEPPLQMTVSQLKAVRDAIDTINFRSGVHVFNDFIIYNGIPEGYFGEDDNALANYLTRNQAGYRRSKKKI